MENSNSCLDSSQDPIFEPCQHHKGACTEKVFEQATEAVNYKHFRISFNEYLLSTLEDLVQIVHYREKLLTSLQVATSFVAPLEDKQDVTWCALSRLSQRYCQRKADMFNWSDDVRQEQEHRLIRILTPCWLMERRNEKLAIEVLKAWRDGLADAQPKSNHGESESEDEQDVVCRYCSENEDLVDENYVIRNAFYQAVNQEDKKASDAAAEFCLKEAKERLGCSNVDYACCMMDHLMRSLEFEPKVRNALVHTSRDKMFSLKLKQETSN